VAAYSFLRYIFWIIIPLCNFTSNSKSEKIPTLISEDWMYAIIMSLFGLSNGYCTALAFIYGSTKMKKLRRSPDDISIGSYLVFIMFSMGLLCGSIMSFLVKFVVLHL